MPAALCNSLWRLIHGAWQRGLAAHYGQEQCDPAQQEQPVAAAASTAAAPAEGLMPKAPIIDWSVAAAAQCWAQGDAMWFWFGFAILALIGEAMTGTFYLLLFAFGLAAGGVAALLGSQLAGQILAVALVTLVGLAILRKTGVLKKREVDAASNQDVNLDIGQVVDVQSWSADDTSRVWYRGAYWQVRLQEGAARQAGSHRIVAVQGATLLLSPENPTH